MRCTGFVFLLLVAGGAGNKASAAAGSSLTAGSVTAVGGVATVPLALSSAGGNTAALQWTVSIPGAVIQSVQAGPAASASGKKVSCSSGLCVLSGMNTAVVPSGVVATISVTVPSAMSSPLAVHLSGVLEALPDAAPGLIDAFDGSILPATPAATVPPVTSLACTPGSLPAGQTAACTVTLSGPAPAAGQAIALSSSSASVTVPSSVAMAASASKAQFNALVQPGAAPGFVTLTATSGSSSVRTDLQVQAAGQIQLSSLVCSPVTAATGMNGTCTVWLSGAAGAAGALVTLTSSDAAVTLPRTVTVPAGTNSAGFRFSSAAGTALRTVLLAAAWNGVKMTATLTAPGLLTFHLKGNASELVGTVNGSIVTPTVSPAGLGGSVTVRGNGYLTLTDVAAGSGLSFVGSAGNTNTAFMTFRGNQLGAVFDPAGGEVQFLLRSRYSFAERLALPKADYRWIFDTVDDEGRLWFASVYTYGGRLILTYSAGGDGSQFYYFPAGKEDSLYGRNVVLQVRLAWNGSTCQLYLNGSLVQTAAYVRSVPNWLSTSSLTIGATDIHDYNGGYYALDDAIADFQIRRLK